MINKFINRNKQLCYQCLLNILIYYLKNAFLILGDDMQFAKETNFHLENSQPKMYAKIFLFYTDFEQILDIHVITTPRLKGNRNLQHM